MKRRGWLIVLLLTSIFSCMVENSEAIYTWSTTFNFQLTLDEKTPEYPIHPDDFLHYEMVQKYPNSGIQFDAKKGEIDIVGEAGAYRCLPNSMLDKDHLDFHVRARVSELIPKELKNIGISFYGSHAANSWGDNTFKALGYVLKFDQKGDLYIEPQQVFRSNGIDQYEVIDQDKKQLVLTADQVKKKIGTINFDRSVYFDIYIHKNGIEENQSWVSVYINEILLNSTPIVIDKNYIKHHMDGSKNNLSIGVSSYQTRDAQGNFVPDPSRHVLVNELYLDHWDGILPPSR